MSRKKLPAISIVVPAYNSAKALTVFLESFRTSTLQDYEIIINDELKSNDNTEQVIKGFAQSGINVKYIQKNASMAQGRKSGATIAKAPILLHLDTDMKVTDKLLEECVQSIKSGYDALVIPEESYGTTFWAKCKWLEKRCYNNEDVVESLRCVKSEIYHSLGGHNERMVFSEDKDFDLRIRESNFKIGRTKNFLYHNEGDLKLLQTVKKKHGYTKTADIFKVAHPEHYKKQINVFLRYWYFLKNIKYFFTNPVVYIGMLFMKTVEFGYGALGVLQNSNKG